MKIVIVHVGMTNEKQRNENNPFSKIFLFWPKRIQKSLLETNIKF